MSDGLVTRFWREGTYYELHIPQELLEGAAETVTDKAEREWRRGPDLGIELYEVDVGTYGE